ncbi:MAG: DUF4421 family protein [Bacteroidetes bacterium]|nr:DUF4421 family protein [Bacteroidota bacterium]
MSKKSRLKKFSHIIFLSLLIPPALFSQSARKEKRDSILQYRRTIDTNYVHLYPDRFILTLSNSYRSYNILQTQTMTKDSLGVSAPEMISNANKSTGASIDLDKISVSFGLRTVPSTADQLKKTGETKYSTFSFGFSEYRFRFETSYRKYEGFYDNKTSTYDTSFHTTGIYWQNPNMLARSYKAKIIWIRNKRKFSYGAAYFNTERQLKSAGSFLLISNIYNYLFSADSSLLPFAARQYYGEYGYVNRFNATGFSFGPGYTYSLVIVHSLFLNLTLTGGIDVQHRDLDAFQDGRVKSYWKTGGAGDFRAALGLNLKYFFMAWTFAADYNSYQFTNYKFQPRYFSVDFNMGYRFHFRERRWLKWLKANKIYQWF